MILVIDDEPTTLRLLEMVLHRANYLVATARSAPEALALLERETGVDLIISDLLMPGMNGLQLLSALRQSPRTRDVPVIFCTSVADRATVTDAARAGIHDFIVKPIRADVVLAKVRTVFDRALPVLGARQTVMSQQRIGEQEYCRLAAGALVDAEKIATELANARAGDDQAAMAEIVERLDQMCAVFGAERIRAVIGRFRASVPGPARAVAATLISDQLVELRYALERAARPSRV